MAGGICRGDCAAGCEQFRCVWESGKQRAAHRCASPTCWAGQHGIVAGKAAAFDPNGAIVAVNSIKQVKFSLLKAFAGCDTTKTENIPANVFAVGGQRNTGFHARLGAIENNGFLRQPLEQGALTQREIDAL